MTKVGLIGGLMENGIRYCKMGNYLQDYIQ